MKFQKNTENNRNLAIFFIFFAVISQIHVNKFCIN